jgi:hypothetical protein
MLPRTRAIHIREGDTVNGWKRWIQLAVVVIIICVSLAWILGHLVCLACGTSANSLIPIITLVAGVAAGYAQLSARSA